MPATVPGQMLRALDACGSSVCKVIADGRSTASAGPDGTSAATSDPPSSMWITLSTAVPA